MGILNGITDQYSSPGRLAEAIVLLDDLRPEDFLMASALVSQRAGKDPLSSLVPSTFLQVFYARWAKHDGPTALADAFSLRGDSVEAVMAFVSWKSHDPDAAVTGFLQMAGPLNKSFNWPFWKHLGRNDPETGLRLA